MKTKRLLDNTLQNALRNTYRAWSWSNHDDVPTLSLDRRTIPEIGPNDVLVENRAIGINPVDWKMIAAGHPSWRTGQVPGVDGAGVVVAAGIGTRQRVGTRVAYHQSLLRHGSFAEFMVIDAAAALPIPDGLDDLSAAALPCPGLTAWQAATKIASKTEGDVLITGASGAVGLLLVQQCIAMGYRVWVTASPAHHHLLLSLGVVMAFDYRDASWPGALATALGPRRLHAIIDTVDSAAARRLAPQIGYNGHLVYIMYREEALPMPVFSTALSVHEVALNSIHEFGLRDHWRVLREQAKEIFAQASSGYLRLPNIRTIDFDGIPAALAGLQSGTLSGKYVAVLNG